MAKYGSAKKGKPPANMDIKKMMNPVSQYLSGPPLPSFSGSSNYSPPPTFPMKGKKRGR